MLGKKDHVYYHTVTTCFSVEADENKWSSAAPFEWSAAHGEKAVREVRTSSGIAEWINSIKCSCLLPTSACKGVVSWPISDWEINWQTSTFVWISLGHLKSNNLWLVIFVLLIFEGRNHKQNLLKVGWEVNQVYERYRLVSALRCRE